MDECSCSKRIWRGIWSQPFDTWPSECPLPCFNSLSSIDNDGKLHLSDKGVQHPQTSKGLRYVKLMKTASLTGEGVHLHVLFTIWLLNISNKPFAFLGIFMNWPEGLRIAHTWIPSYEPLSDSPWLNKFHHSFFHFEVSQKQVFTQSIGQVPKHTNAKETTPLKLYIH
jgi:hypothetical protein